MITKEKEYQTTWNKLSQEQKDEIISNYIFDFSTIPYDRTLPERGLYPFSTLNYLTGGMELGEMSIIAGETGSGKTTFITQTVSQMLSDGDKVFCVYGESTLEKQTRNTYRQMIPYKPDGYEYVVFNKNGKPTNIGQYFVNSEGENKVKSITKGKLYYYKTSLGMSMDIILDVIDYARRKLDIKYFVIDNIMQITTLTDNENKEMKDSIELARLYTIEHPVHIAVIGHYRKNNENGQIRRVLQDVCGTSSIGNKMATALNVIRLDNVDRSSKQYKSLKALCEENGQAIEWVNDKGITEYASAVVEVLKTRHNSLGFIALGYNKITNNYYELWKYDKAKTKEQTMQPTVKVDKTKNPFDDYNEQEEFPF